MAPSIRLRLLGAARLEDADGRLAGEAAQRHRIALLALLATARDATLPRERLLAWLWPEQGERNARHSLNVAVHVLRKALGDGVLRTEGPELRLDSALLPSDLGEFTAKLARGELEMAVAAYGGPLLDGFFLDEAPGFAHWVDAERARLQAEFEQALETLAERAEADHEWAAAVRHWRRLVNAAPDRSRSVLRLMRALEAAGEPASALQVADAHAQFLESELGASPSPEVRDLAARIKERPRAAVTALPDTVPRPAVAGGPDGEADLGATPSPGAPGHRPETDARTPHAGAPPATRRWRRPVALALGALLVLATAFASVRAFTRDPASVAVLPFQDLSAAGDLAYLGDGLTEELLNTLARLPGLRVAARSSAFQYREPGVDVREVGRALDVSAVVEGSVRRDGRRLRITAQLIDARNGYHLWSNQYDRTMDDIFALQEEIAREVATELRATMRVPTPDAARPHRVPKPEAYDLYLRGRHAWNQRTREEMVRARDYFEQAVALDPEYANAYAGLADAWQLLPDYSDVPAREGLAHAKTAALRAIALDSTLAEAHAALGALLDDYDRDRAGAERAYRRAIALNPRYATARQWLAIHLADEGRIDEALVEIEHSRRLDPRSRILSTAVGAVQYFARDYAQAIAEYRAVLDRHPDFALAWALMGRVYLVSDRADSAVAMLARAVRLSGGDPSYRAVHAASLAAAGDRTAARALADSVRAVQDGGYVPSTELAAAYIRLGDHATALALFERAFEERDPAIKHLAAEPMYDGIRSHPRFIALLERAGLAP